VWHSFHFHHPLDDFEYIADGGTGKAARYLQKPFKSEVLLMTFKRSGTVAGPEGSELAHEERVRTAQAVTHDINNLLMRSALFNK